MWKEAFPLGKPAPPSLHTTMQKHGGRGEKPRAYPALCPHSFTTFNQFALRLHTMLFTLFVSVGAAPVYVALFVFRGWMVVNTNK